MRYFVRVQEPWVSGYRPWTTILEVGFHDEALNVARSYLLSGYNVCIKQKEDK